MRQTFKNLNFQFQKTFEILKIISLVEDGDVTFFKGPNNHLVPSLKHKNLSSL